MLSHAWRTPRDQPVLSMIYYLIHSIIELKSYDYTNIGLASRCFFYTSLIVLSTVVKHGEQHRTVFAVGVSLLSFWAVPRKWQAVFWNSGKRLLVSSAIFDDIIFITELICLTLSGYLGTYTTSGYTLRIAGLQHCIFFLISCLQV